MPDGRVFEAFILPTEEQVPITQPKLGLEFIFRREKNRTFPIRYPGLQSLHSADRRAGTVTKYPQWAHLYVFEIADNYSE